MDQHNRRHPTVICLNTKQQQILGSLYRRCCHSENARLHLSDGRRCYSFKKMPVMTFLPQQRTTSRP